MKKDEEGNVYARYKHLPLTWGPYIFVCEARKEYPSELVVRLGPLTGLFFVSYITCGFFGGLKSILTNFLVVCFFFSYFYFSLSNGFKKNKI